MTKTQNTTETMNQSLDTWNEVDEFFDKDAAYGDELQSNIIRAKLKAFIRKNFIPRSKLKGVVEKIERKKIICLEEHHFGAKLPYCEHEDTHNAAIDFCRKELQDLIDDGV